jgi:hypothetical protein
MFWPALLVILAVVPLVAGAQQASNASGTLTVNGVATKLEYAYAFHDPAAEAIRVLVVPKALTAELLAGEVPLRGSRGDSAFRESVARGEASAIELFVQPGGEIETVIIFDRNFSAPTPTGGEDLFWAEPYRMPDGWIGGRSRTKTEQEFFDNRWTYDIAHFAPVGQKGFEIPSAAAVAAQRKEIEARETPRILPADGGEEGAAYLAFYRNLETGDVKAALDQMTLAMIDAVAERMDVAKLTPADLTLWAMSLTTPPGKVEIVGGVRDQDGTLMELRRTNGSRVRFGAATMVQDGGVWKVAEMRW